LFAIEPSFPQTGVTQQSKTPKRTSRLARHGDLEIMKTLDGLRSVDVPPCYIIIRSILNFA
jgi:hypothetical protein